jgi:DNA-binding transcriptional regulator GbsR (MarR family)
VNDSEERRFAEDAAVVLADMGLPPSYGKMLGWLLICDPPEHTVTQVAEALGLSKGSVSTGFKLLESGGLIRRVAAPGRRGTYYEMTPDAIIQAAASNKHRLFRELMERGLAVLSDPEAPRGDRLRVTRDFYAYIERQLPQLIAEFQAQQLNTRQAQHLDTKQAQHLDTEAQHLDTKGDGDG